MVPDGGAEWDHQLPRDREEEEEGNNGELQFTLEGNLVIVTVPSHHNMGSIINNMGTFGPIQSVRYDPDDKTLMIEYSNQRDAENAVQTISQYGYEEFK